MNADEVIDIYVRDVARRLPRGKRNDVAFELRALLADELGATARAEGRAPDKDMAMALLKGFGRPAETANRYHERPAVIDPAHTHHFVIWALAGAVALGVLSLIGPVDGALFVQWLGVLVIVFAVMGWWRRRHPNAPGWTPRRGPDWMPRPLASLAMAATLVFPVFMYAAPQTFVQVMFLGAVPADGLQLAEAFEQSGRRAATVAFLATLAALYAVAAVQNGWRAWTRWTQIAAHICLGALLIAHAAPMHAAPDRTMPVFQSPAANEIAMPTFALVGALIVLCAMYDAYREWSRIRPAPALKTDPAQG